ncbi:hypothetical protein [Spirosoma linguale]|uniref:Uncharacterized protein n=1 Tax=Spirosoma linguale (strain ATCC 33905 / DSM 74 / LMG 10896 / Claus 1) TaxID=504472 RepID=D2QQM2_SPILD|nr:hypothetical protein Slin_4825 [Spirosoma linguale DSM 74]
MFHAIRLPLLTSLLVLTSLLSQSQSLPLRAKLNETVWVIAYPVKATKRTQYEHFIHDIFWPGAKNLAAPEQKVFRQTRVMHPIKAEADGSYTYLFIMDPVIPGADYGIESLLKKMYGPQKGAKYFSLFKESVIERNYTAYRVTQSKD